jgi:hypothetical protein
VLKFISAHVKLPQSADDHGGLNGGWPTVLMGMICGWAPVQDRYAILVGAMETLIRSPIVEDDLENQLVLATVIDYLLSSTINFIGLSIMDVLVGLISHILLLLQLGGGGSTITPHHQQTTSVFSEKDTVNPKASGSIGGVVMEVVKEPSWFRIQLLNALQKCMASLATHVYYTDQISDMVGAILTRLKPSPLSGISSAAEAIEDPTGAATAVASSASLNEKSPHVDKFFSFETARLLALDSVKAILITANTRRPDGSTASVSRGSVGVRVWEDTQWLLRDPSGKIRKAYVDALITWLNLEKRKVDLEVTKDLRKKEKENDKGGLARRAVSNASHREKASKGGKDTFLALLHLAVYENALQYTDSESDLLLLHLLLTTLVNKLGVNAVRTGLPMIWRLQEDIQMIEDPGSKVRIGSLVHGYLWALSMALDFETSSVGRALHAEISRRNSKGLWVKSIRVPPAPLSQIQTPHPDQVKLPDQIVQSEALKPFDNREALVDKIADGYSSSLYSPPSSPPTSPGRSLSMPMFQPQASKPAPELPQKIREELLVDWTRDDCISANTKDSSSASMTGSRTATTAQQKNNYLGVSIPNGNLDSGANSPVPSPRRAQSRPPSIAYGLVGRVSSPHRNRSPSRTPGSTSSLRSAVRVEDLKRVLSGSAPRTSYSTRPASHRRHESSPDTSASDSMVSVHSLSDASFVTAEHASIHPSQQEAPLPSTHAATLTPKLQTGIGQTPPPPALSSPHSPSSHAARERDAAFTSDVPPVPPIPASLRDHSVSPTDKDSRPRTSPSAANGTIGAAARKSRSIKRASAGARSTNENSVSRTRSNGHSDAGTGRKAKQPDFAGFLASIDVGEGDDGDEEDDGFRGVGRAPY